MATHPCVATTAGWEIFTNGSVLSTLTTIAHSHTPHTELALIVKESHTELELIVKESHFKTQKKERNQLPNFKKSSLKHFFSWSSVTYLKVINWLLSPKLKCHQI